MEAIPVTAAPSPAPALDTETLYRAVIGPKHTDYFLQYFARRDAGGRFWSWNWPAFFVALFWSLYRKAWGFALGSIALTFVAAWTFGIIAGIAMVLLNASAELIDPVGRVCGLLGGALPATLANGFYHRKVKRVIAATATIVDREARLRELARRGGTSKAWIWLLVGIVVAGILAGILVPAYNDYVKRANAKAASLIIGSPFAVRRV